MTRSSTRRNSDLASRPGPGGLTAAILRAACGPRAYERGNDYFRRGRAMVTDSHTNGEGDIVLWGVNRGSGRNYYRQEIYIEPPPGGMDVFGQCSCPMGMNCKHVVATCLAWKAGGGGGDAKHSPGAFEQWLEALSDAGRSTDDEPLESMLYVLLPDSGGAPDISVELIVAKRKRNGEWGKGRRTEPAGLRGPYSRARYMRPVDDEIMGLIEAANRDQWGLTSRLAHSAGHAALQRMLDTGRVFWSQDRAGPLTRGEQRGLHLEWTDTGGERRLQIEPVGGGVIVPVTPPCYVDPSTLQSGPLVMPEGLTDDRLPALMQAPPIAESEAPRVSRLLARRYPALPTPVPVPVEDAEGPPVPKLVVDLDPARPDEARARLSFCYGDAEIRAAESEPVVTHEVGERLVRIRRDASAEEAARQTLREIGLIALSPETFSLDTGGATERPLRDRWIELVDTTLAALGSGDWIVETTAGSRYTLSRVDKVDAEVERSDDDWFNMRFDLEVDGWLVPLMPLVSQVLEDYEPGRLPETLYLDMGDNRYAAVAARRIEPVLRTIVELHDRVDNETLRLSRLDAPRLLDLGPTRVRGATSLQKLASRLRDFKGIRRVEPPRTFKGRLRDYQQQGLNWLQFLREHELAGILADDMGLGKTVQALAHLATEKRAGRMHRPSLIVAPTSLMGNWRREAQAFTPRLKVLVLQGPERSQHFDQLDDHDLVLTTYALLPRDHEVLVAQSWHYLILDEAQQVKNPRAKAAQVIRAMHAEHRLCMTGTPMENHLGELWAQLDFLLPGFLGDEQTFRRTYRTPIEKHGDTERLASLNRRIKPFVLRRTKEQVAKELPEKSELLRSTPITGQQAQLYESVRLTMEKKVREAVAKKGLARSHITILDALLKLRQVCCDPRLLPAGTANARSAPSAKLQLLMEILPQLLDEGRRILLFSQFTKMLGLIEREIEPLRVAYSKLTGQTRDREAAIERFRSGDAELFLVSLKAGGTGLNLTEADTVIHYDPWWNPAVENQATDRAHRIGQDKPVFIHKLITEGTVEEKILELQERKRRLAEDVHGGRQAQPDPPIDAETIEALLAHD